MTFEKNGIDLSINFMSINQLGRVETALNRYLDSHTAALQSASSAGTLLHYCQEIFEFIDEVYGSGTHEQIFGTETDYSDVVSVYETIVNGLGEVRVQLAESQLSIVKAQADRRARTEALEAEYEQIKEANKAALEADKAKLDALRAEMQKEQEERAAQQNHDTSVPYSDRSGRPRVPLAVQPVSGDVHIHTLSANESPQHSHTLPNLGASGEYLGGMPGPFPHNNG